ncbi:hypothetical protein CLAFUW4_05740 [Fulvia fulva]|uniref:Uncharacterized protein n=1 Tax=Passalora fulva TaxID=5499 RepID=A0A9Q8LH56_PASFU|nr:uncharacterized protein CLAFUR5_05883 [Fulvia fulva]KAK4624141.1 hypothetical protein CLAFUR4_05734 [Fulvia fulva]KAK4625640.1 hypothetical protein CLAFUR0_05745 [Fulvia fulva]UJO17390.1 hypothetical protein CLAFUR5_05883 [Fulvia fulva]WPV14937.1 hypothetical protein CLAFUW4_05740 [Fulvia fulva]WPV30482.1 hypothetical protein CLAFUW7_05738 [Fulvia fulva]
MAKDPPEQSQQPQLPSSSGVTVSNALTGVTGTVGAVVGGVTRTTGGLIAAVGRGAGGTFNNATKTEPVGNGIQAVTDGFNYGASAVSRGLEDLSAGKKPGSTDSTWDHR